MTGKYASPIVFEYLTAAEEKCMKAAKTRCTLCRCQNQGLNHFSAVSFGKAMDVSLSQLQHSKRSCVLLLWLGRECIINV